MRPIPHFEVDNNIKLKGGVKPEIFIEKGDPGVIFVRIKPIKQFNVG
jgi:hypothetical protein